jgi:monofunctional biosynthetic peptidoglycan transglycosylase
VEPARLSPSQAALLAAVLPSPTHLRVERPSAYVQRRQARILAQMDALAGSEYAPDFNPPRR